MYVYINIYAHTHTHAYILLKMIKEDNIGDVNKLYLILHKVGRLLLENCRMGQKAGGF